MVSCGVAQRMNEQEAKGSTQRQFKERVWKVQRVMHKGHSDLLDRSLIKMIKEWKQENGACGVQSWWWWWWKWPHLGRRGTVVLGGGVEGILVNSVANWCFRLNESLAVVVIVDGMKVKWWSCTNNSEDEISDI